MFKASTTIPWSAAYSTFLSQARRMTKPLCRSSTIGVVHVRKLLAIPSRFRSSGRWRFKPVKCHQQGQSRAYPTSGFRHPEHGPSHRSRDRASGRQAGCNPRTLRPQGHRRSPAFLLRMPPTRAGGIRAYHYKEPSAMRNPCLLEAERIAKDSWKGIWQDVTHGGIRPWEHRRNRGESPPDI